MKTAIVGLGSILMGDDGVGPYCLEVLKGSYDFPEGVELVELGTPGPEFGHILLEWDRLIAIDSVKASGEPGSVRVYDKEAILSRPAPQRLSPHDPSLRDALLTADFVDQGPREVVLIGIIPERVEMGTELSPTVERAVAQAVEEALRVLSEWQIEARPRPGARAEIWWSRSSD